MGRNCSSWSRSRPCRKVDILSLANKEPHTSNKSRVSDCRAIGLKVILNGISIQFPPGGDINTSKELNSAHEQSSADRKVRFLGRERR